MREYLKLTKARSAMLLAASDRRKNSV